LKKNSQWEKEKQEKKKNFSSRSKQMKISVIIFKQKFRIFLKKINSSSIHSRRFFERAKTSSYFQKVL